MRVIGESAMVDIIAALIVSWSTAENKAITHKPRP